MFKKLLSIILAISMCAGLAVYGFAAPSLGNGVTVDETIHANGDRTWYIVENGKFSTIEIYHDKNYILVDNEKIYVDEEISLSYSETDQPIHPQLFAMADPEWVYIYSNSYSVEATKKFNTYTIGVLSALIAKKLGLGYFASGFVAVATIAITDYANENVMDMERDVYGSQHNLNHYMYEDFFYIAGEFIESKTIYNPPIY